MYTVGNLKDGVAGILSGTNLDNVTNINQALERTARKLLTKLSIPEATAVQSVTLYDGVFDYTAPTNIFGTTLLDFRPQGNSRSPINYPYKIPITTFDRTKKMLASGTALTFEYDKGTPILRVSSAAPTKRAILDTMAKDTGWTAAGSAGSLTEDDTVFYDSPQSLRFTLTGSSTGTLTKTLTNALSLAKYENNAVGFLAFRASAVADLTSLALLLGSDSSNYDTVSVTQGFLGAWTAGEWLLVAFDFSGATSTGTPDWTAIDYVQLQLAHTATIQNVYVGGLWLSLPTPYDLIYETAAIFLNNGALSKTITDDDDEIVLNDAAYVIYENLAALEVVMQDGANSEDPKVMDLEKVLYGGGNQMGLIPEYESSNPSGEIRILDSWYD